MYVMTIFLEYPYRFSITCSNSYFEITQLWVYTESPGADSIFSPSRTTKDAVFGSLILFDISTPAYIPSKFSNSMKVPLSPSVLTIACEKKFCLGRPRRTVGTDHGMTLV